MRAVVIHTAVLDGEVFAPGEDAFIMSGWQRFSEVSHRYATLDEAFNAARWAIEDNTWCPEEIRNIAGDLVADRDAIRERYYNDDA